MKSINFFLVVILLFGISCDSDDDTLTPIDDIIQLKILSDNGVDPAEGIRADGSSLMVLQAKVPDNADDNFKQIKFSSTNGTFLENSEGGPITANENGKAQITMRVTQTVERVFLSAQSGDNSAYTARQFIDLDRAFPETLTIEPSSVQVTIPGTLTINVFMERSSGKVSIGTPASFNAIQTDKNGNNIEVGRFTGVTGAKSNAEGNLSVVFHTDTRDIDVNLPVQITVSAQNDDNESITGSVEIMTIE